MKNVLKEKMLSGERTLGTFFETGSTTVAQCLGLAGLDYIIIDNEHGPFDPQSTLEYVRAAKLYGLTPLARVSEISRPSILRLLDVGVMVFTSWKTRGCKYGRKRFLVCGICAAGSAALL